MIFQRISPFTGKLNQMDLPVTEDQVNKYNNGALIQDAFPNLNASQREFLKTGLTDDDWDSMFPPDDGEEIAFGVANKEDLLQVVRVMREEDKP